MFSHKNANLKTAILLALVIPLYACAQEAKEDKPKPNPDGRQYQPFSIKFDLDGTPVLLDAAGEVIKPQVLQYPIKATSIERVDSVVILQATGSHFKVVKANNKEYIIPLPH